MRAEARRGRLALVLFGVATLTPLGASAQFERYTLQFEGALGPDRHVGSGEGSGVSLRFDLQDLVIDTASNRMSADIVVRPDAPLSPDEVERFAEHLGFRLLHVEATVLGVAHASDSGWRFTLPNGTTFLLDVPESHALVAELGAAGAAPQRLRVLLYRDGTRQWHMSWLPEESW